MSHFNGICFVRSGESVEFVLDEFDLNPRFWQHREFCPATEEIREEFEELPENTKIKYARENITTKLRPSKIPHDKHFPEDVFTEYDELPEEEQERIPFDLYAYARKKKYVYIDGELGDYPPCENFWSYFDWYYIIDKEGLRTKSGETTGRGKIADIDWDYIVQLATDEGGIYHGDFPVIDSEDGWDNIHELPDGIEPKEGECAWGLSIKLKAEAILQEDKDAEAVVVNFHN